MALSLSLFAQLALAIDKITLNHENGFLLLSYFFMLNFADAAITAIGGYAKMLCVSRSITRHAHAQWL